VGLYWHIVDMIWIYLFPLYTDLMSTDILNHIARRSDDLYRESFALLFLTISTVAAASFQLRSANV
jgi:hypothetical protein